MVQITRQQLCADLGISESTVRRLEHAGLPFISVGKRTKRYDLAECKAWLRDVYRPGEATLRPKDAEMQKRADEFSESCQKVRLRVKPS
jgi:phage terminase Nu1 subunit (DNA packaging protein)